MWGKESFFPSNWTWEREDCLLWKTGNDLGASMQNPSCVQPLGQGKKGGLPLPKLLCIKERNVTAQNMSLTTLLASSMVKFQPKCTPGSFSSSASLICGLHSKPRTDPQLRIQRPESFSFYFHATHSPAVYWSLITVKPQFGISPLLSLPVWYPPSLGADSSQKSKCLISSLNHDTVNIPDALQARRSKQMVTGSPSSC